MTDSPSLSMRARLASVALTTLVAASIVGLVLLTWTLRYIFVLFFAAVVLAVIVWSASELVRKAIPLRRKGAVAVACILIGAIIGVLVMVMGTQVAMQLTTLRDAIPVASAALNERFGIDVQQWLNEAPDMTWIRGALGYVPGVFSVVSSIIMVIAGGLFLALDPEGHREGFLQLFPLRQRDRLRQTLNNAGSALQRWLVGQLIAMAVIGVATAVVLTILGVPSALALGLIAGLLEFIPYIGAIVAYIPLGIAALGQSLETFWWVLGAYIVIQQTEGNVLMPLVQKRTVELPPVIALFSLVAMAMIFGPLGIAFGVPLTVVLLVGLRELYIGEVLGDAAHLANTPEHADNQG
ncbi:AI-2E family transporter [Devosia submarina]|uniref:AI-2E family transporter n=1 Tax=Devosia submarina TaxID=1173082 RepID=UPI000D331EE7|nr:AI-2E family transporter [Devosia submarina]